MSKQQSLDLAAQLIDAQQGRDDGEMVTVTSGRASMTVKAFRAGDIADKLRKMRAPRRGGSRVADERIFPEFHLGMSTAEYVGLYAAINSRAGRASDGSKCISPGALPYDLASLNTAPCTLYENGALDFDVIEETMAEKVAPVAAVPASPEYVAMRTAARAARRAALAAINTARVSSAQAMQAPEAPDDVEDDYSYLIPTDGTHRGGVHAAKNIRLVLKRKFPGVKFSVKSDYSSCNIKWQDGPTDAAVSEAVAPFDIGYSDSMTDYFTTVATKFSETYGGVQYLFTKRELGAETIKASIKAIYGDNGPTYEEWQAGRAWRQVANHGNYGPNAYGSDWDWLSQVRRHANGLDY